MCYFHDEVLWCLTIVGCGGTGFCKIPDGSQHEISFDSAEGVLAYKVTICISIESDILIQQVVAGEAYHEGVVLQEFLTQGGVQQGVIEVVDKHSALWPQVDVSVGMDEELPRQINIEIGMDRVCPVFGRGLDVYGRTAVRIGGGGPKAGIVLFILGLVEAESERVAVTVSFILQIIDDTGVGIQVEIREYAEIHVQLFQFTAVVQIGIKGLISIDIDGLGGPFAAGIYVRTAAKGVLGEVIGSIYPDAPFRKYFVVSEPEIEPMAELRLEARVAENDIERVIIGPDGLYLVETGLVHAAVIAYLYIFLSGEIIVDGGIGIPVDKPALRVGIGMDIPLIEPGKADTGTSPDPPFLFYERIVQTTRIGEDIELIVVAVQGIQAGIFAPCILIIRAAVGMAVVDGQAVGAGEKRDLRKGLGIGDLGVEQHVLGMEILMLIDNGVTGEHILVIEAGGGSQDTGRCVV